MRYRLLTRAYRNGRGRATGGSPADVGVRPTWLHTAIVAAGLLCLVAGLVFAAAPQTSVSAVAELASNLSQGDAAGALSMFDRQMPGYGQIEANIQALAAQTDVSCAIEIVADEEAGGVHKMDLDWLLTLKSQSDSVSVERRRERVQVEMKLVKGKWKITAFSPVSVLDPIHVR